MHSPTSENLKVFSIRSKTFKRSLLLHPDKLPDFIKGIEKITNNEVFVLNGNIGMEIYYLSPYGIDDAIKVLFGTYASTTLNLSSVVFQNKNSKDASLNHFSATVVMLSKHPQLFLATSKKFIHMVKKSKKDDLIPLLLFDVYKKTIVQIGKNLTPYLNKINQLKDFGLDKPSDSEQVIKSLIAKALESQKRN